MGSWNNRESRGAVCVYENALGVLSEACAHGYSLMFNEGENNDEKKK